MSEMEERAGGTAGARVDLTPQAPGPAPPAPADAPSSEGSGSTPGSSTVRDGEGPPGSSEPFRVEVDRDLEDLVPQYLQNKRKDAQKIREALDKGEFDTVRVLGHSMAGSGGGYGFPGITRIGRNIERYALAKDADAVRGSVHELEIYLSRVVVEYV